MSFVDLKTKEHKSSFFYYMEFLKKIFDRRNKFNIYEYQKFFVKECMVCKTKFDKPCVMQIDETIICKKCANQLFVKKAQSH